MEQAYIKNIIRQYGHGGNTSYQAPAKTIDDYKTEIKNLEREIELANIKIKNILNKNKKNKLD
jgi:hypothetical protein